MDVFDEPVVTGRDDHRDVHERGDARGLYGLSAMATNPYACVASTTCGEVQVQVDSSVRRVWAREDDASMYASSRTAPAAPAVRERTCGVWSMKGAVVRGILESFIKDELVKRGYQPVYTPHIGKIELYQTSGHYPYYKESQFPTLKMPSNSAAKELLGKEDATKEDLEKQGGELSEAMQKVGAAMYASEPGAEGAP